MKRYIEIVIDNSGSMTNTMANGKSRLENAKTLIKDEITKALDFTQDCVVVRTLRTDCEGRSITTQVNGQSELYKVVDNIYASGLTPLYNTVKDSLNACRYRNESEKVVFVLTDGDDTCGFSNNLNYTADEIRFVKTLNVVLLKYAVVDAKTNSNLEWFAGQIGAKTISVASTGRTDFTIMKADLLRGLSNAGLVTAVSTTNVQNIPVNRLSWADLKNRGVLFYQAELLYNEGFLKWKPSAGESLEGIQWSELLFLWSLRFGNGLPVEIVRTMLWGLQRPYAYSQSGLFWDFEKNRWILPEPKPVERVANPDASKYDQIQFRNSENKDAQLYNENEYYEVEEIISYTDIGNISEYKLADTRNREMRFTPDKKKVKKLRKGDIVQFVQPAKTRKKDIIKNSKILS